MKSPQSCLKMPTLHGVVRYSKGQGSAIFFTWLGLPPLPHGRVGATGHVTPAVLG